MVFDSSSAANLYSASEDAIAAAEEAVSEAEDALANAKRTAAATIAAPRAHGLASTRLRPAPAAPAPSPSATATARARAILVLLRGSRSSRVFACGPTHLGQSVGPAARPLSGEVGKSGCYA